MKKEISTIFLFLMMTPYLAADLVPEAYAKKPVKEQTDREYKAGELIVKFKKGVATPKKENVHKIYKSEKIKEFPRLELEVVELHPTITVEEAVELYSANLDVAYAEPNFIVNADDFVPWGINKIETPRVWNEYTTGSSDVVIAVIDTGIDYTHEDLAGNMWTNPGEIAGNGVDDDGNGYVDDIHGIDTYHDDPDPMDDHYHGTHCAGTIGAVGDNGIGIAGVNWNVQLMACKFLGPSGVGYTSDAIGCLEYVSDMNARNDVNIIATSNSWGCSGPCYSQAMYDAIQDQMNQGILFIAAAGNNYWDNDIYDYYPANYDLPNILSIAATDITDNKANFSNYGRRKVHVGAPGVNVYSTKLKDTNGNDTYGYASGTSMATPHVAGLAALLKADAPSRDWIDIKNRIMAGGDGDPVVTSMADKTISGKRINAYGSLNCSDNSVFSALKFPDPIVAGEPTTLSAMSIRCEHPVGPVTVSTCNQEVDLYDDGFFPDQVANDGIFSASWTPPENGSTLFFESPVGDERTPPGEFNVNFISILPPSPAQLGNQITLEAAATGQPCDGETLEYKFEAIYPEPYSDTDVLCDWQLSTSCSWDTADHPLGTYTLKVGARMSSQVDEVWATETYQISSDNPVFSINDVSVSESGGILSLGELNEITATFTVSLSMSSLDTLTVMYQSEDGSATENADYVEVSGTLTFYPGEQSKTIDVTILDDESEEGDETFTVLLSNPSGDSILGDASGECTIIDDLEEGPEEDLVMVDPLSLVSKDGLTITIGNTVRNNVDEGSGSATASYVGFYLSTDSTITTDDIFIGDRYVSALIGGAESYADTTLTIPGGLNGYYYLGAIADYSNLVSETDENNNSLAGEQVDCTPPPLDPDFVVTADGGRTVSLSIESTSFADDYAKIYIYWGDQRSSYYYSPFSGPMTHTYPWLSYSKTYEIKVRAYTWGHLEVWFDKDYDPDLGGPFYDNNRDEIIIP